ncbi:MAG: flagellar biosynthesis protein FlhB [Sporomusaceae bacterium]|nr:flagellar biosynthesis protein FlhB [Sporomusaceae bacterium]
MTAKFKYTQFDLQLFAGEKTEDPTAKRLSESREKGQVAKSQELNAVIVLFVAFYVLNNLGTYMYTELTDFMVFIFSHLSEMREHSIISVMTLFKDFAIMVAFTVLPFMLAVLISGLMINYYQVGILFTTKVFEPDLGKLNPINGFGRLFSLQSVAQLFKSVVKIIVVTYFVYQFALLKNVEISMLTTAEIFTSYKKAGELTIDLVWRILLALMILALFDYAYQLWQHNKNLKMSKQEVKEEYKQSEGDPKIKSKIKQKQRELAMRRMMQEVPTASVVVTNPTHLAIALKYEQGFTAPLVVAKGKDFVAERIKAIAKEHNVITVENKPLAQTLYPLVEVGDIIPPELYQAVAELLAYVYRLKKRPSGL